MKSFSPEFYNFPKFSENFETVLVNVHCQFCLTAELIQHKGAEGRGEHTSVCARKL